MSDYMSQSYHDVMEVYRRPMSVRYIPTFFWAIVSVVSLSLAFPDAQCHWYVQQADNTFGEGFDWENAPWFDVNGLNDVPAIQASTAVQKLQERK